MTDETSQAAVHHRADAPPHSAPRGPNAIPRQLSTAPLTRRSLLAGGAAGMACAMGLGANPARALAPRVPFGAAVQVDHFEADADYRALIERECDLLMPSNELKFGLLRPTRPEFWFDPADRMVNWARSRGMVSRGHAFVWWSTNPPWLEAIRDPADAERVLVEHIERVAEHYRGRLGSWDVVNEVIANDPREPGGPLRDTWWRRRLGARHISLAFRTAMRADPSAKLVINDYDLEFEGPRYDARRAEILHLVRQLQDEGLRVDMVGLQAHLYSHIKVDREALARFGRDLKALGVGLLASELDVIDFQVRGDADAIDAAAERSVSDFLDGLFAGQRPYAVITWGISDRYTWVPDAMPRTDGQPNRPLPFDAALRPKPWYVTLRQKLATG
ncbi:endo-1,4-beta-xylanase [Aureimonas sp. N4]|uniref:endo-1,4-beta-xylanase n=1 Tax=Aureimonas sp. N4 TaxID=1638165 RepID=UPI001FCD1563|nr:endo-1,4-beta-xylanase [Aureimonas sp. N4]